MGMFQLDTAKVLSAVVDSLRDENRLAVFTFKGSVKVQADRSYLWLFKGHQELIVPAAVTYYVDLSDLTLADVTYDEKAKLVRVALAKLTLGDIAFQPEQATYDNSGILTWSEEQVDDLRKLNYRAARRGFIAQAQQEGLRNAAQRQAKANIEGLFQIPLRVAGLPDVKVAATFK